jgi:pentatricopeptide repeat protein
LAQLPVAMQVYEKAKSWGVAEDPILINALINTCAKAGDPAAAIGVVAAALRARVRLHPPRHGVITLPSAWWRRR